MVTQEQRDLGLGVQGRSQHPRRRNADETVVSAWENQHTVRLCRVCGNLLASPRDQNTATRREATNP